ncbi:hypothetical protein OC842_002805 [Tilletia horrida]|uniref:Uncharacterized protein n=1 Tax=Tilletia horrida TaxID=155126 RepID=A0AAN6JKU0_9BASI|nr:hypothetical protein OC842_002805 [Tilletia horrida]
MRNPLAELPLEPFIRAAQAQQLELLAQSPSDHNNNKRSSSSSRSQSQSQSHSRSHSPSPSQSPSSARARHATASQQRGEGPSSFSTSLHAKAQQQQPHSPIKPSPLSPHGRQRYVHSQKMGTPSQARGRLFESELRSRTGGALPLEDGADALERSPATVRPELESAGTVASARLTPRRMTTRSSTAAKEKCKASAAARPPSFSPTKGRDPLVRGRKQREASPSPAPAPGMETREQTPAEQLGTAAWNERPHKESKFGLKAGSQAAAAVVEEAQAEAEMVGLGLGLEAESERVSPPAVLAVGKEEQGGVVGSPSARLEQRSKPGSDEETSLSAAKMTTLEASDPSGTAAAAPITPVLGSLPGFDDGEQSAGPLGARLDRTVFRSVPAQDGTMAGVGAPASLARKQDRIPMRPGEVEAVLLSEAGGSPSPRKTRRGAGRGRGIADEEEEADADETATATASLARTPVLPDVAVMGGGGGGGGGAVAGKGKTKGGSGEAPAWDGTVLADSEEELEKALSGVYALAAFEARKERKAAREERRRQQMDNKGEKLAGESIDAAPTALAAAVIPKLSARRMAPRQQPAPTTTTISSSSMVPTDAGPSADVMDFSMGPPTATVAATAATAGSVTGSRKRKSDADRDQDQDRDAEDVHDDGTVVIAPAAPSPTAVKARTLAMTAIDDNGDDDDDDDDADGTAPTTAAAPGGGGRVGRPAKVRRSE